jgi:hypothetical protein
MSRLSRRHRARAAVFSGSITGILALLSVEDVVSRNPCRSSLLEDPAEGSRCHFSLSMDGHGRESKALLCPCPRYLDTPHMLGHQELSFRSTKEDSCRQELSAPAVEATRLNPIVMDSRWLTVAIFPRSMHNGGKSRGERPRRRPCGEAVVTAGPGCRGIGSDHGDIRGGRL